MIPWLSLAAGAISTIGDFFSGGKSIRNQINAQKELADYQFQLNQQQWAAENEYNSPGAQMQRLKSAGLNPNLVYGSGAVTGNTTTQGPRASIPHVDRNQLKFNKMVGVASTIADIRNKMESNALLREEIKKRKTETEHIELENQRLRGFYDYDLEDKRLGIERLKSTIDNIQSNTALTNQQKATEIYKLVEMRSRVKLNEQQRRNAEVTYEQILAQTDLTKQQKENAIALYSSIIANTNLTIAQIKNATATFDKIIADTSLSVQSRENMLASYTNILLRNASLRLSVQRDTSLNHYWSQYGMTPGGGFFKNAWEGLWNLFSPKQQGDYSW